MLSNQPIHSDAAAQMIGARIYLKSPRQLNVVDTNVIGIKHGETIPVEHKYWINLDTDNFGRLRGIELLSGGDVAFRLNNATAL